MKISILFVSLLSLVTLFVGCVHCPSRDQARCQIEQLIERQKIQDTVNKLFIGTDNKDWLAVRGLFADKVNFDMSSLSGAAPALLSPVEITDMWEKGLRPVEQVHHQSGNFLVTINDNKAEVFCYGTATHYKNPQFKGRVTRFVGSYNIHLIKSSGGWTIDSLRFNKKYVE